MDNAELSKYFSDIGKKGGEARWKKIGKKKRAEHARKMALASHKKDFSTAS